MLARVDEDTSLRRVEVVLNVSHATFAEIREKLIEHGSGGTIGSHPRGGELIELTGVAICPAAQKRRPVAKRKG